MSKTTGLRVVCVLLAGVLLVACTAQQPAATTEAPPAPTMPEGWTVTADLSFPPDEVARVGERLGGELESLRNTDYEVNGKRVRINTMVAPDQASADRIMASLREMKPEQFLLRRSLVIYELVGDNEVIPEMQAARAAIAAQ